MNKLLRTILLLSFCVVVSGCSSDQKIQTIRPGVLAVAVTSDAPTNQYDSQLWIRRYVEQFAAEAELEISWVVVPSMNRGY